MKNTLLFSIALFTSFYFGLNLDANIFLRVFISLVILPVTCYTNFNFWGKFSSFFQKSYTFHQEVVVSFVCGLIFYLSLFVPTDNTSLTGFLKIIWSSTTFISFVSIAIFLIIIYDSQIDKRYKN